jgi:hypothetical protein
MSLKRRNGMGFRDSGISGVRNCGIGIARDPNPTFSDSRNIEIPESHADRLSSVVTIRT